MLRVIGKYVQMVDQLILNFPSNSDYFKDDFYVSLGNKEAYQLIESWPKWIKRTINIHGPAGSGKTHLASILKNKASSFEIQSDKITEKIFLTYKLKEILIVENYQANISENLFFSIYNMALQDNKYLLITSELPLNTYKIKTPDLKSRIDSSTIVGIKLPSDDLISVILSKRFSDKQIAVEKNHIDYIVKRIDRSYEKISQFILTLDKYSLKKGSSFGLKLIKEVLNMI